MYRNSTHKAVKRVGLSTVLALGVLGTGVGLAGAASHPHAHAHAHARHGHAIGTSSTTTWERGLRKGRENGQGHQFAVRGTISAISLTTTPETITLTTENGSSTFTVNSSTIVSNGPASATLADLAIGQRVFVTPSTSDATVAASVFITVNEKTQDQGTQDETTVEGVVTVVTPTSVTIAGEDGASATFTIDSSTTFTLGDSASTEAALATGEKVHVTPSTSNATTAGTIAIDLVHVAGTVSSTGSDTFTVTSENGQSVVVMTSSVTSFTVDGSAATFGDVKTGEFVVAAGTEPSGSTSLNALSVAVSTGQGDDDQGQTGTTGDGQDSTSTETDLSTQSQAGSQGGDDSFSVSTSSSTSFGGGSGD